MTAAVSTFSARHEAPQQQRRASHGFQFGGLSYSPLRSSFRRKRSTIAVGVHPRPRIPTPQTTEIEVEQVPRALARAACDANDAEREVDEVLQQPGEALLRRVERLTSTRRPALRLPRTSVTIAAAAAPARRARTGRRAACSARGRRRHRGGGVAQGGALASACGAEPNSSRASSPAICAHAKSMASHHGAGAARRRRSADAASPPPPDDGNSGHPAPRPRPPAPPSCG